MRTIKGTANFFNREGTDLGKKRLQYNKEFNINLTHEEYMHEFYKWHARNMK